MDGQLALEEETSPLLTERQAEALGLMILGFVRPGTYGSGAKVPTRVREQMTTIATGVAKLTDDRLRRIGS